MPERIDSRICLGAFGHPNLGTPLCHVHWNIRASKMQHSQASIALFHINDEAQARIRPKSGLQTGWDC